MINGSDVLRVVENDVMSLQQIQQTLGDIFAKEENIHQFTQQLGQICRTQVMPLEIKYSLITEMPVLSDVIPKVLAITPLEYRANVQKVLSSIQSASINVEPETGIQLQTLFLKTWMLASHPLAPSNAKELIIDNLHHNILTEGGCLAGIAGRLIQPYSAFVSYILKERMSDELQMEQALLFSMSHYGQSYEGWLFQEEQYQSILGEDEALRLATERSLDLS